MKAKILIVDDEAELRGVVKDLLGMEGYETAEAGDAASLRRQLDGAPADLVLLDLKLPDGDGLALLPEIKQKWPNSKVIILTGYGTVDVAEGAFKTDDQIFLQSKPFDAGILKALVELALTRKGSN
jgi:DNA-binding NtrC family response regulator